MKPHRKGLLGYLVVITVGINTHILTIFILKFLFFSPQNTSKVKGPFSCNYIRGGGVGGGVWQTETQPSINNNGWTRWQFIVLWSDFPQRQWKRGNQHLKKPRKGPTWTKTWYFKTETENCVTISSKCKLLITNTQLSILEEFRRFLYMVAQNSSWRKQWRTLA